LLAIQKAVRLPGWPALYCCDEAFVVHAGEAISPELLYSVLTLEGLTGYFDYGGKKARTGKVTANGFGHVGFDDFGTDAVVPRPQRRWVPDVPF
jgi:hypothetical protein